MNIHTLAPVVIVGQGPVAARVFAAFQARKTPVRVVERYDVAMPARAVVVVEQGVQAAFESAMRALGQGIPVVTDNAVLVAVHGRVLENAAMGQQAVFGFAAALGVVQPLAGWMASAGVRRVRLVSPYGANAVLQRMLQRGEDAHKAQMALELQGQDMTDAMGKRVYARALAVHVSVAGVGASLEASRSGPEAVDAATLAHLRRFGFSPVMVGEVMADTVRFGMMAGVPDDAVMQGFVRETAMVETAYGEMVLNRDVVAEEAVAAALVTDVDVALRGRSRLHVAGGFAEAGRAQYLVIGEYVQRHRLLEMGAVIVDEQLTGQGDWVAVVEAEGMPASSHWMCVPVAGRYEASAARLRLVG